MKSDLMKSKKIKLLLLAAALLSLSLLAGCLFSDEEKKNKPLVIKPEDFSIFLFESSEEIYRANVKHPGLWAGLREQAGRDPAYSMHYNWLYSTYGSFDNSRRAQLREIMETYHHQQMSGRLIDKGKQGAGLAEIIDFIKEDRFFRKKRDIVVDFYSWYGSNYAQPHYKRVKPLLQNKVDEALSRVEKDFDIVSFVEKESGIKLKKKPESIELLLNMRVIGASGFYRDKDSLSTIRWNSAPQTIWAAPLHEVSHAYFRTFTGGWTFKYLVASKLKKDEQLMARFKADVPYTWEGWVEENLVEGFARYLMVRKGITKDAGEGIYVFDQEYAQALLDGFDPKKTSLEDFTLKFLQKKYGF